MSLVATTDAAKLKHEQLLALYASGWTKKDLAARFDYSQEYVNQLLREPEYVEIIRGLQKLHIEKNLTQASEIIQDTATEAVLTLRHLMRTSTSDNVRAACANSILDRVGLSKRTVVELESKNVITDDTAAFFLKIMEESRADIEPLEMVQDSAGVFTLEGDGSGAMIERAVNAAAARGDREKSKLIEKGGYGGPSE